MATDLVIRGGTVIDGTGAPGRRADVAISGDRIEKIGAPGEKLGGARELDASGQVVAPGFIDIHTHYDAQVFWDPALTPSCFHGVTTVVAGNCGFSIAPTRPEHRETIARTLENVEDMDVAALNAGIPWDFESFPQYLDSIRSRGTILNYNAYVGHTALRLYAMGDAAYERFATAAEIEAMQVALREAMLAGAAGLATSFAVTHVGMGGKPVPSRYAEKGEFEALCKVVGEVGKGVIHVAPGEQCNFPDLYPLQREIGRPITWAALLTFPGEGYRQLAELNAKERAAGADVWPQVSPRPLTFQFNMRDPFLFNQSECFAGLIGRGPEARLAAYRDPEFRKLARTQAEQQVLKPRWETFEVAESEVSAALVGRRILEIAQERGAEPLDVILDIALDEELDTRFRQVLANDDEEGVAWLLTQEGCALGLSDAGAHVSQLCDAPLPTELLGKWVREREIMPIERAVHKLTQEPATIFGFRDRGELRAGAKADVVVFDPNTVAPGPLRRVRDFPANCERLTADAPGGMTHLLVNGTPIRENGTPIHEALAARPGEIAELA